MKNFRTLKEAKRDRDELQDYINLVELYKPKVPRQHVVFQYALHGSINKASDSLNVLKVDLDGEPFTPENTKTLLLTTPSKEDELHKTVRRLFLKRGRTSRRKINSY
ncbi:hypothetical protein [Sporosarcina sp. A2]|uniref:hypothetical protein n=1 Tax=Sporosarcina sp. A2 TaxID=3393449 RepID=UPI003D7987E1